MSAFSDRPLGKLVLIPARDLKVLRWLQRDATPPRLKDFDPWLVEKEGILHVAHITTGRYKGVNHPYDGGTRWKVMMGIEPDYPFRCWQLDMTEKEAAQAFLAHNKDSRNPSAEARFTVGVQAGEPGALAIKWALDAIPLKIGRASGKNEAHGFAAFAAAERIVLRYFNATQDWGGAAERLRWVLSLCGATWPVSTSTENLVAYDNDIIQAVAAVAEWNDDLAGDEARERSLREAMSTWYGPPHPLLDGRGQLMRPAHWRMVASARGHSGGSESRGTAYGRLIAVNHNRADHDRPGGVPLLRYPKEIRR